MNSKDQFLIKYSALTVGHLKSLIEEFNLTEQICMNSNFTEEYTLKLVNDQNFENFQPIIGAYLDDMLTFYGPFGNRAAFKSISYIAKDLKYMQDDIKIERDVDEGYRFESYESVLITKTHLIFF